MALRKTIFATNEVYHVYNRGVEKRPIFLQKRDYDRFLSLLEYYRFTNCPIKFSYFKLQTAEGKQRILTNLNRESKKLVDILAFCLMPNHFHLLLKQLNENGISKFMAKITNGFSHYFNTKYDRTGHLFQGNFGAIYIASDEQYMHVSRYIHLNPVVSYLVKPEELETYAYSSYISYITDNKSFCNPTNILGFFKNIEAYKKFVLDHADYALKLKDTKHLFIDADQH